MLSSSPMTCRAARHIRSLSVGASLATSAGATTAGVMARLGHTTPAMATVYQHSLDGADARVADDLPQLGTERPAAQEALQRKVASRPHPGQRS